MCELKGNLLPITVRGPCELCPVPTEFAAKQTYLASSLLFKFEIVSDGVVIVEPEYLELDISTVEVVAPVILCQYTEVACGLADIVQPRVIESP